MDDQEPQYLRVRNWHRFQHYSDRNPPWIKNYTDLDSQAEPFSRLSFSDQGKLQAIWRLAAKLDNVIPYDERYICRAIRAKRVPIGSLLAAKWLQSGTQAELKRLSNAEKKAAKRGFPASKSLAARKQSATPEVEREKEPPKPPLRKNICPFPNCGVDCKNPLRLSDHLANVHDQQTPAARRVA